MMNEEEHWMNRQLRLVAERAKDWPQWRHEEAKRRFGTDATEPERLVAAPVQETVCSAPTDTPQAQ